MLNVYAAAWCPHCQRTVKYLEENDIRLNYIEIEEQSDDIIQKIVDVNGGLDWVVPTLEYQGKWRPGKVFNAEMLESDLQEMGVVSPGD
jgi:mycoredoxin